MATTIHPPETEAKDSRHDHGGAGAGGRNLDPPATAQKALHDRSSEPARTGIWVGLAAITMSFAAFTSALVVRQSTSSSDWRHLTIPGIVFFNTGVLIVSSATLEVARRRVAAYMQKRDSDRSKSLFWMSVTLILGLAFVLGQYTAWLRLRAEGLYLATNPNSSFFYVLTAVHAIHVLGGLGGLARVLFKLGAPQVCLRRSTMDAAACYWHFMGVLWIYLLSIIWLKL